jgi:hypothetical protein
MSEVVINEPPTLGSPISPAPTTALTDRTAGTLSPPPPAVQDEETAQLVDAVLAKRHSKSWRHSLQHSPLLSPLSPNLRNKQKQSASASAPPTATVPETEGQDEAVNEERAEESVENGESGENGRGSSSTSAALPSTERPGADEPALGTLRRGQRKAAPQRLETFGSVKMEDLLHKDQDPLTAKTGKTSASQKVLYRYADVYENQRGWVAFTSCAHFFIYHYLVWISASWAD